MDNKRLMVKLNQIASQNLGKIMYALFLMSILETLSTFFILSPVMRLSQSNVSLFTMRFATFFLAFISILVWLTFQFGFAVMLLQMVRRKPTNVSYIFIGFKCFNAAGKIILSVAGLFALLTLISRFISKFIFLKLNPDFSPALPDLSTVSNLQQNSEGAKELLVSQAADTLLFLGILLLVLFILSIFVMIRFVFVFHLHFDNPHMKILSLFRRSYDLIKGNILRLILFAIRAGGKQLFIAIFLAVFLTLLPEEKSATLSALVFILDLIYFVNLYTAMIRIYLTVPVLYEEILHPNQSANELQSIGQD